MSSSNSIFVLTQLFIVMIFRCSSQETTCKDVSKRCDTYKERGYCGNNFVEYMKKNCAKTCAFCKVTCEDVTKECNTYKERGYCTEHYVEYMEKNCAKTCAFCKDPISSCKDTNAHCSRLESYCGNSQYKTFMETNCQKTCKWCGQSQVCPIARPKKSRVVGGEEALANAWPWQVGLTYNNTFICGGTLISTKWVMTAAHCVSGKEKYMKEIKVYLGMHNRDLSESTTQQRNVIGVELYDNYNLVANKDDIALLKLNSAASETKEVAVACLPSQSQQEFTSQTHSCYITGWGHTSSNSPSSPTLQEASLPVVSNEECGKVNVKVGTGLTIDPGQVCAGATGSIETIQSGCRGDSGGPYACRKGTKWTVEGVVSWGSSTCTAFEKYTVFTRVSFYRDWIDKKIKN